MRRSLAEFESVSIEGRVEDGLVSQAGRLSPTWNAAGFSRFCGPPGLNKALDFDRLPGVAKRRPLFGEPNHFRPHGHQPERGFRAVEVVADQVAHGGLRLQHFAAQHPDLLPDFVDLIVHHPLEQSGNLESSDSFEKQP
jgi:hypothetical protein